ncbi:MAG: DUF4276 family protein [Acidobacteriota bacterium]|nr:DUF4276 family protein [Acidobacteriota bacterium]
MEIKLYVEGGGKGSHKRATIKLQQGFDSFFKKLKDAAQSRKISFRIIPSGNSQNTYEDFIRSVENSPQSFNVMLVDSDDALAENESARDFLQKKYKKWKLKKIADEQCHLMVQIMESWFIADVDALKKFYGQGFNSNAIPKNSNVETIAKSRVESSLKTAILKTNKSEYHKIVHGAKLLELINPQKICEAAPHCRELFKIITEVIEN